MTTASETSEPLIALSTRPSSLANEEPPPTSPVVPVEDSAVTTVGVIGTVDRLTDAEQAEFDTCEAVVAGGWRTYVEVGLALGRIRDAELYRVHFDSFDAYCRTKWDYARQYAYYLIAAAQTFKQLSTNCGQRQPDHESQVRPLVGLKPDQAQLAWECAVQMAGGKRITARMVKSALRALDLAAPKPEKISSTKATRAKQKRLISDAFSELLLLLSQKAAHDLLAAKVEALHRHVQLLVGRSAAS